MTTPPPPVGDALDGYWDDQEAPDDEQERQAWRIDGDRLAGWAMRKLAARQAELDRLTGLYDEDVAALRARFEEAKAQLDDWLDDATAGARRDVAFFEAKLLDYARSLAEADPYTARTRPVAGGKLTRRRNPASVDISEDPEHVKELVDWCLTNDRRDLLTITPSKAAIKAAIGLTLQAPGIDLDPKGNPTVPGQTSPVCTAEKETVPHVTFRVGDERYSAAPDKGVA